MASKLAKAAKTIQQPYIKTQYLLPIRTDNVITTPHKTTRCFMENISRMAYRKETYNHRNLPRRPEGVHTSEAIIRCTRRRLNHYEGQTYPYVDTRFLASHGWRNSKSNGDKFVINFKQQGPHNFSESQCFESLPDFLRKALLGMGITRPTVLQAEMMEHYVKTRNHILCTSHTGSGKTLTYLLPIIKDIIKTRARAVALVPSLELCNQLEAVCLKLLDQDGPISSCSLMRKPPLEEIDRADILLGTPGKIIGIEDRLQSSGRPIRHIVVDEADTLLDHSFYEDTSGLIKHVGIGLSDQTPWTRLVFVSATECDGLKEKVLSIVKHDLLDVISSDSANLILPHVPQYFYRICSLNKLERLTSLLRDTKDASLVFCKTGKAAIWLNSELRNNGINSGHLSKTDDVKRRAKVLQKFKDGSIQCVCATDALSRGVDTQWVSHVVNYDFPVDLKDYIHRCGRVGRLGSQHEHPRVTNFISKPNEATAVQRIEMAVRGMMDLSTSIDEISAEIAGERTP